MLDIFTRKKQDVGDLYKEKTRCWRSLRGKNKMLEIFTIFSINRFRMLSFVKFLSDLISISQPKFHQKNGNHLNLDVITCPTFRFYELARVSLMESLGGFPEDLPISYLACSVQGSSTNRSRLKQWTFSAESEVGVVAFSVKNAEQILQSKCNLLKRS